MSDWIPLLCLVCLIPALWMVTHALSSMTAGSYRERDRERQDYFRLIEHLVAQNLINPTERLRLEIEHRAERVDAARQNSKMEMEAGVVHQNSQPRTLNQDQLASILHQ